MDRGAAITAGRASKLLRAAARLAPARLVVNKSPLLGAPMHDPADVELPCFARTVSLGLGLPGLRLKPPKSGEFTALQNLSLDSVRIDLGALLPLCPCLRVLEMDYDDDVVFGFGFETVTIHSASLERLAVNMVDCYVSYIDMDAPMLKMVHLKVDAVLEFGVSFSAPMLETLYWNCIIQLENVGFGEIWRLTSICECHQPVSLPGSSSILYAYLCIDCVRDMEDEDLPIRSLVQEIAQLPVPNFAALNLRLNTKGHVFGPLVLHLLSIRPSLKMLKISCTSYRDDEDEEYCSVDCPCKETLHMGKWKHTID